MGVEYWESMISLGLLQWLVTVLAGVGILSPLMCIYLVEQSHLLVNHDSVAFQCDSNLCQVT